ncbi:MAG: hypothetical protein AAGD25_09915 [Cyanobacteria bacterium P01_F01_bin.150]
MSKDVQQWLIEIQSLQQRLAQVSQDKAAAYEQISRWQQSYQTEAQQRRKDIQRLRTVIYRLDRENKRLKQQLDLPPDTRTSLFMANEHLEDAPAANNNQTINRPTVNAPLSKGDNSPLTARFQQKLQEMMAECDRLAKALSQEQSEHEQTRQTLMTALGDTIEQLERERQRYAVLQSSTHRQERQSNQNTLPRQ